MDMPAAIIEYFPGITWGQVSEVVEECGFGSLRTFLRVFKSVEGITPGQYKSTVVKER